MQVRKPPAGVKLAAAKDKVRAGANHIDEEAIAASNATKFTAEDRLFANGLKFDIADSDLPSDNRILKNRLKAASVLIEKLRRLHGYS